MDMMPQAYQQYVQEKMKKSPIWKDVCLAFIIGGAICVLGQAIQNGWAALGLSRQDAGTATSCSLVALSSLLTGLNLYNKLARFGGAGTLVPITGFSNAVTSPALDFKSEGFVTGMAAKMFTVAGPVITFGTLASVVYGIVLMLVEQLLHFIDDQRSARPHRYGWGVLLFCRDPQTACRKKRIQRGKGTFGSA